MEHYIEFNNVVKKFGDFVALDNVSLKIPKGAFVTLLGPSGCGKTTLMRQLAGFSEPDAGEIIVDGKPVNGLPPFKRNTPLVFQEYALFPHMTVYENISYGLRLHKLEKSEIDSRVSEMLEMFNLVGMEKRYPKQLSGGQQQRVAFARALVMGQEILLLDEPLSNLDAKLRVDVRNELRQIQQKLGITTIYVTHDQDEALSMSDIIAVMRKGCVEQVGTPWEIYFRPANRFVADFVGTVNFFTSLIQTLEDDGVLVTFQNKILKVPSGEKFSKDENVTLVVRPEYVRILEENEKDARNYVFEGIIEKYSFLGRVIRYWVKIGNDQLIIDDENVNLSGPRVGNIYFTLDATRIHILKDGGSYDD